MKVPEKCLTIWERFKNFALECSRGARKKHEELVRNSQETLSAQGMVAIPREKSRRFTKKDYKITHQDHRKTLD